MKQGIIISSTKSADEATPEEATFDSDYGSLKTKLNTSLPHSGTISPVFATDPGIGRVNLLTISHEFGFTPGNMVQWSNEARDRYGTGRLSLDAFSFSHYIAYADDKQFKIDFVKTDALGASPSLTKYTFRYTIFANEGA